jgi:hypothetical protein
MPNISISTSTILMDFSKQEMYEIVLDFAIELATKRGFKVDEIENNRNVIHRQSSGGVAIHLPLIRAKTGDVM